jgi:uncharacterized protein (TIGR00299 family) protein
MKLAYFQCISGISGDMALGALVDAGLPLEALEAELAKLRVPGFALRATKVRRGALTATQVEVLTDGGDHAHRHLADVLAIIDAADLAPRVAERASAVFRRLAEAEAEVHNTTSGKVHFHEVGAIDAIVDVVGAVVGLDLLGVEHVYSSPLRFGTGQTVSEHGTIPIPAPATLLLTRGVPAVRTTVPFELVTPTGAAIITTLAESFGLSPVFAATAVGYGAGSRDIRELPNVLRLELGEAADPDEADRSTIIETNVDDMSPEVAGYVVDRLLAGGAKDAFLIPVIMKKGRPGVLLTVLTDRDHLDGMVETVFEETTTLGVRIYDVDRRKVRRRFGIARSDLGPIKVKIGEFGGRTRVAPEYEDCARIARQTGRPILDVYDVARSSPIEPTPEEG